VLFLRKVNAKKCFLCSDTVGWVKGMAWQSAGKNTCTAYLEGFSSGTSKGKGFPILDTERWAQS